MDGADRGKSNSKTLWKSKIHAQFGTIALAYNLHVKSAMKGTDLFRHPNAH